MKSSSKEFDPKVNSEEQVKIDEDLAAARL